MCPGSVVQPFCEEYICCYFVLSQSLDVAERPSGNGISKCGNRSSIFLTSMGHRHSMRFWPLSTGTFGQVHKAISRANGEVS